MPFTFSHPAIVLPFAKASRNWLSLTALVIGSMAPDFEYFIRMRVKSIHSHSLIGLLWFDLPLTLISAFIFHNVVRSGFISNLPIFLGSRLTVFNDFDWNSYFKRHYVVVIISALIGAFSHIAWDSFTHEDGFVVQRIAALAESVIIFEKEMPIYKLIQHSSSLIGAVMIGIVIFKLPALPFKESAKWMKYWLMVIAVAIVIITVNVALGLNPKLYGHVLVTAISGTLLGLVIASTIFNYSNN